MRTFFLLLALGITTGAFGQTGKITFLNEREFKSAVGSSRFEPDQETASFTSKGSGAIVYIRAGFTDINGIRAKDKLMLWVAKKSGADEEYAYSQELRIPQKAGHTEFRTNFTPGEYIARIYDKDNESDVYVASSFTVIDGGKPDYKNNSTMAACASVNDDWNPVGETKKIKAGSCIQILYKASKSLPVIKNYFMVWAIRKVAPNGDEEYVNDLLQTAGDDGWRYLAAENVCEFKTPGKYRVYILEKSESDALHGVVAQNYYGKMELIVE
jgi:hypothetical protein